MYSYINIDVYVFALLFTVLYLNFLEKKEIFHFSSGLLASRCYNEALIWS
jgi:hypothetical protein